MPKKPESTKYQGIPYDFGGRVLVIPPLSLGAMEKMQDRLTSVRDGRVDQEAIAATIETVHAALKRNYPDMTREEVADLIDLENMQAAMACAMDVGGLKRKALESPKGDGHD